MAVAVGALAHRTLWKIRINLNRSNIAELIKDAAMKFSTKLRAKLLVLAGALVFGVTGTGIVHAADGGYDMPDSVAPGDSAAVRDTSSPNQDESIKEKWSKKDRAATKTTPKYDNSRYSTDGTERYDDDEGDSGTGPKLPGRY